MARILVAEDHAGFRTVVSLVLGADNHDVHCVGDGREALAYLKDHTPDLIVLDIDMPFLDGIGVCERVKRISRLKRVPVVILTGRHDLETERRAQLAGADLMVNKPLEGKDFRQLVAHLLQQAEAA